MKVVYSIEARCVRCEEFLPTHEYSSIDEAFQELEDNGWQLFKGALRLEDHGEDRNEHWMFFVIDGVCGLCSDGDYY